MKNMMPLKSKISFNFDNLKWEGITIERVKLWESAFPDVDVVDVLTKRIPVWLDSNPQKACKYKNWKRFIVGWLSRQQSRYDEIKYKK